MRMVFPEVVPGVMIAKLIADFVSAIGPLRLTLAPILNPVGTTALKIRSPLSPIAWSTLPRTGSFWLASRPPIGSFSWPALSSARLIQERRRRSAGARRRAGSRRRTR